MPKTHNALILLSLALSLTACKDKSSGDDTSGADDTGTPVTDASIAISAPADGATVSQPFAMTYTVTGLDLDTEAIGATNEEGHGHVHIYVDGIYTDATADTSYTFSTLTAGEHTLEVRLAENDHTELAGTSDAITVTADGAGAPVVAITSPDYGDDFDNSSVEIGLFVSNFTLSDDVGGTNVAGSGHYHILVDGTYYDYNYDSTSAWVTRLAPGTHEISVELVNNDHSPLSPDVMDTTQVVINAGASYVEITDPVYGSTLNTSSYELGVDVDNFTLDPDNIGGTAVDGTGHYHVYVDGEYQLASGDTSTWLYQQTTGSHVVMVVLADNDHTELGTVDYVRIYSPETRPYVAISSPPLGEVLPSSFAVTADVENFTLADKAGESSVDGEGHYHVLIDGTYWALSTSATTTVSGVPAGDHTLTVELVNNDHSSLAERVIDEMPIIVE